MSRHCCMPGCDVNSSVGRPTLFHVPAKKYYAGQKFEWADSMEKVIRSFRKDKWLDSLYSHDNVWICKDHFIPEDIVKKGSRMELRIGAIIQLKLPSKCLSIARSNTRPLPTARKVEDSIYHKDLADLKKSALRYLPKLWQFQMKADHIMLYSDADFGMFPKLVVTINESFSIHAAFHGWFADIGWALQPSDISKMTLSNILHTMSNITVCHGISQNQTFNYSNDDTIGMHYKTSYNCCHDMFTIPQPPTSELIAIRSKRCQIFLKSGVACQPCIGAERNLKKLQSKKEAYRKTVENVPVSRIGLDCSNHRLISTMKSQKQKLEELQQIVSKNLSDPTAQVPIDQDLCSDLSTLFAKGVQNNEISAFFKLFWEEQAKINKVSKNGRRFHPELIRFCLGLAMKSTCAYEQLRDSGILVLPSKRTLFEYRSIHSSSPGFLDSTKQELMKKARQMKDCERLLVLSMDEIKVKENIVYSTSMDRMVGFVDVGKSRISNNDEPATHALQVYARGLVTPFSKPLAYYATKSIPSYQLCSIFWECIGHLVDCGFQVVAFVADGLSANRKMFHELNNLNLAYPYKCQNIFKPEEEIFLIFDPPHLLKTVRNNLFASRNKGTKVLFKDGKHIRWEHFEAVPKLFKTSELRVTKLTDMHFRMHSYSKMRVIYAAQLLSNSVARLMRARGGEDMEASAWFAETFNRWFDLMNSTTRFTYNNDLKPYRSADDVRLQWLERVFLPQLRNWRSSCSGTTQAEKAKKFLSWQTYEGLETTTRAIVELIRKILSILPNDSYIITRRLNQDPLEAFFGQVRRSGGTCENPDIAHYGYIQRIIGVGKDLKWRRGSNVMLDTSDPAPKRKKSES